MSTVEELITVHAGAAQARRALTSAERRAAWIAPHVTVVPVSLSPSLAPGDRFRIEAPGGMGMDYLVEAVSEREVVMAFSGMWTGHERWSFVPDGADTIVRRVYDVDDAAPFAALAWMTVGRAMVMAHFKLEMSRFRAAVERDPGMRAEIPAPAGAAEPPRSFPVDDG